MLRRLVNAVQQQLSLSGQSKLVLTVGRCIWRSKSFVEVCFAGDGVGNGGSLFHGCTRVGIGQGLVRGGLLSFIADTS